MVDCRGCVDASLLSSVLTFLLRVAPAVVLSLGTRGFRGLVTLISAPSGPTSFFFRCRLTGAAPFDVDVVLLFAV
jgi:hypothetical protein